MFKQHKNSNKIKVEFLITVIGIKDFPKSYSGREILMELKRGKKKENHQNTSKQTVKEDSSATWKDEKSKIAATLFQDQSKKTFEPKKELIFVIKEEVTGKKDKKESEELGRTVLGLTQFADAGTIRTQSLPVQLKDKKEKKSPTIMIKIETSWLKINNKAIVKKTTKNEEEPTTGDKPVKTNDEDYVLESTNELTEGGSGSDDEENIDFSEEENKEQTPSQKIVTSDGTEDVSVLKMKYEAEISDLQKDKTRLEKKMSKMSIVSDENGKKR